MIGLKAKLACVAVLAAPLLAGITAGCGEEAGGDEAARAEPAAPATTARTVVEQTTPGGERPAPARTVRTQPGPQAESKQAPVPAPAPEPAPRYTDTSPEYYLAVIDGRPTADTSLDKYRRLIDGIRRTCKGNRMRIADQAVNVKQLVESEGGPTEPVIAHLRQLRTAVNVPGLGPGRDCTDIFATYVLLRVGGQ